MLIRCVRKTFFSCWFMFAATGLVACGSATIKNKGAEHFGPPIEIIGSGGKTTGALEIKRIELLFHNERAAITLSQGKNLGAQALVRFDGNGLFRAQWLVDGRVVQTISTMVANGNSMRFRSSPGPVLTAFEPGKHTVSLKVLEPKTDLKSPVIHYFLTLEPAKPKTKQ